MRRARRRRARIASRTSGTSRSPPPVRAHLEALARGQREQPPHDAELALAVEDARSPRAPPPTTRPGPSAGACSIVDEQCCSAQRLRAVAVVAALEADDRPLVGAGAAHDRARVAGERDRRAEREQRATGWVDVEASVEPVRAADATRRDRPRSRFTGHVGARRLELCHEATAMCVAWARSSPRMRSA